MSRLSTQHSPAADSAPTQKPQRQRRIPRRLAALLLGAVGMLASGCGSPATAESGSALVLGLPKCDASLLHPRITIAAAAALPGKLIVYVDGVMACLDEASRVDQLVSQVEGRSK